MDDGTTRILCRSSVGVVTFGLRDRFIGAWGQAVGTVERLLVHLEYELELIARRSDPKLLLLLDGE